MISIMGFRSLSSEQLAPFNSAAASELLELYDDFVDTEILSDLAKPSAPYIAPSGLRCPRAQWFRLRGTEPDGTEYVDRGLDFSAKLGTAIHRIVQSNLKKALQDDWISVSDYLSTVDIGHEVTLNVVDKGLETQIEFKDMPLRFACDGIIRLKGQYYLVEIKTVEFSAFRNLTDVKPEHVDQIKCYGTMLKLKHVIVIYVDRQYGGMKMYELTLSDRDMDQTHATIDSIIEAVDTNIAPARLPNGDTWCSSNRCKFYRVCKQWGR